MCKFTLHFTPAFALIMSNGSSRNVVETVPDSPIFLQKYTDWSLHLSSMTEKKFFFQNFKIFETKKHMGSLWKKLKTFILESFKFGKFSHLSYQFLKANFKRRYTDSRASTKPRFFFKGVAIKPALSGNKGQQV